MYINISLTLDLPLIGLFLTDNGKGRQGDIIAQHWGYCLKWLVLIQSISGDDYVFATALSIH